MKCAFLPKHFWSPSCSNIKRACLKATQAIKTDGYEIKFVQLLSFCLSLFACAVYMNCYGLFI